MAGSPQNQAQINWRCQIQMNSICGFMGGARNSNHRKEILWLKHLRDYRYGRIEGRRYPDSTAGEIFRRTSDKKFLGCHPEPPRR